LQLVATLSLEEASNAALSRRSSDLARPAWVTESACALVLEVQRATEALLAWDEPVPRNAPWNGMYVELFDQVRAVPPTGFEPVLPP
jgi:hypothetical protein